MPHAGGGPVMKSLRAVVTNHMNRPRAPGWQPRRSARLRTRLPQRNWWCIAAVPPGYSRRAFHRDQAHETTPFPSSASLSCYRRCRRRVLRAQLTPCKLRALHPDAHSRSPSSSPVGFLSLFKSDAPSAVEVLETSFVSYTHLRAHETRHDLVCRLL